MGSCAGISKGCTFISLSAGSLYAGHMGHLPENLPGEYMERFDVSCRHILQIGRHEPWTVPEAASIVDRIGSAYLTHELAAGEPEEKRRAIKRQRGGAREGPPRLVVSCAW